MVRGSSSLLGRIGKAPHDWAFLLGRAMARVGPYSLDLPTTARYPDPQERATPHRSLPQFRIGKFDVHVSLGEGSLDDWREHVNWTTKHRAAIVPFDVNGFPGLRLPPGEQRLDYTFQGAGMKRLDIVAWSDFPTTAADRAPIEQMVVTLTGSSNQRLERP